jgi:hypothetical protein
MGRNLKYTLIILSLFLLSGQIGCDAAADELAKEKLINAKFCGYNTPNKNQDCFDLNTSKSNCCVITWANLPNGGETKACLPESSSAFKGNKADFTIDNLPASINCGITDTTGLPSKFFLNNYCGTGRNQPTIVENCRPLVGETSCCFLSSVAATTYQGAKTMRTCILAEDGFKDTVVAQTLFPGSDTTLTCYNALGQIQPTITIAVKQSSFIKIITSALIGLAILYFM